MRSTTQMQKEEVPSLSTKLEQDEKRKEVVNEVKNLIEEWDNFEIDEKMERRSSIIFSLTILSPRDRELCVTQLAKKGIIKKKEALKEINEYAKNLGFDEVNNQPLPPFDFCKDFLPISPSLDFLDGTAYVAVSINQFIDNKPKPVNYIVTSDQERFRLCDEELTKRSLYMDREPYPKERWSLNSIEDYLNGKNDVDIFEVFKEIESLLKQYVDFENEAFFPYLSCYIISTYFHRMFKSCPYIHLNGVAGCGKTKTLTLVSCLSFNGVTTANSTPAYIIRSIHNNHATCCVDEAESLKVNRDQDNQMIISMYNTGYKKGVTCGKCEPTGIDGRWDLKNFESFGFKVFASIKGLEPSLKSRCVPITMLKSGNLNIQNSDFNVDDKQFQQLRDKLYHVLFRYFPQIKIHYEIIKDDEIFGREWELWKPIFSVAQVIDLCRDSDRSIQQELRKLALDIQKAKKEASIDETIMPKLLLNIYDYVVEHRSTDDFHPISEIIAVLKNSEDEDFSWLKDDKIKANRGKWLGNQLRLSGVVDGRAKAKRIEKYPKPVKGFYLKPEVLKERLKILGIDVENENK